MDENREKRISDNIAAAMADMKVTEVPVGFDARLHDALNAEPRPAERRVTPVWTSRLAAAAAVFALFLAGTVAAITVNNNMIKDGKRAPDYTEAVSGKTNYSTAQNELYDATPAGNSGENKKNVIGEWEEYSGQFDFSDGRGGEEPLSGDTESPALPADYTDDLYDSTTDVTQEIPELEGYAFEKTFTSADEAAKLVRQLRDGGHEVRVAGFISDGSYVILESLDDPEAADCLAFTVYSR